MMIGIVLVTHGNLASEFVAALEHVVGKQTGVAAICIGAEDDMEQRRKEILETVAKVDQGKGVVLLTDMFGGTPSNLAISVLDKANVEVIAGVNLPMLIKLASVRGSMSLPARGDRSAGSRPQIHQRRLPTPESERVLTWPVVKWGVGMDHRPPRPRSRIRRACMPARPRSS